MREYRYVDSNLIVFCCHHCRVLAVILTRVEQVSNFTFVVVISRENSSSVVIS